MLYVGMRASNRTNQTTVNDKDNFKTKVIFRYWFPPEEGFEWNPDSHWGDKKRAENRARKDDCGVVIALFPEIAPDMINPGLCQSYLHIGQHGSADFNWIIQSSVPATPADYKELKKELERLCGYNLEVVLRCTPQMQRTRHNELERMNKVKKQYAIILYDKREHTHTVLETGLSKEAAEKEVKLLRADKKLPAFHIEHSEYQRIFRQTIKIAG